MNTRTSMRRGGGRRLRVLIAGVLVALSTTGLAAPADAGTREVQLRGVAHCYSPASGLGAAQVGAPIVHPMPYTNYNAIGGLIGDNNQRVTYRPFMQRWTGTSWVMDRLGPVFTGTASVLYPFSWDQGNGRWSPLFTVDPRLKRYYRFGAEIWWNADAHHAASYWIGLGDHQQTGWGDLWYVVNYCTF